LLIVQFGYTLSLKVFYVIDWKMNQDIITEKYCENKDKPMMNCNGKCYLSKQLEKAEQQEQDERNQHPNPKQKIEKSEHQLFVKEIDANLYFNAIEFSEVLGGRDKTMMSQPHLSQINPPPQVVLFTA